MLPVCVPARALRRWQAALLGGGTSTTNTHTTPAVISTSTSTSTSTEAPYGERDSPGDPSAGARSGPDGAPTTRPTANPADEPASAGPSNQVLVVAAVGCVILVAISMCVMQGASCCRSPDDSAVAERRHRAEDKRRRRAARAAAELALSPGGRPIPTSGASTAFESRRKPMFGTGFGPMGEPLVR